jgi:hypothetical protein
MNIKDEISINKHGMIYKNGRRYDYCKKYEVIIAYHDLWTETEIEPTMREVSDRCKLSLGYVCKVIQEFKLFGYIEDPKDVEDFINKNRKGRKHIIDGESSIFLLALRAEDDTRPLYDYVKKLHEGVGLQVSYETICQFF